MEGEVERGMWGATWEDDRWIRQMCIKIKERGRERVEIERERERESEYLGRNKYTGSLNMLHPSFTNLASLPPSVQIHSISKDKLGAAGHEH